MSKTVLIIPDIHLWYKDISSLQNRNSVAERILTDITKQVKENKINHVILGGDVCHSGYKDDIETFHSHFNLLTNLSNASIDENYIVCGNHALMNKSTNPEVYINQPCRNVMYKPPRPIIYPDKPLFQMAPFLKVEDVIISMHSYHPTNNRYFFNPNGLKHIAIYHDAVMLNSDFLVADTYYSNYMYNVDYAVINHIHDYKKPYYKNQTLVITPGSVVPTAADQYKKSEKTLQLPLFKIDGSEVIVDYIEFDKYLDEIILVKPTVEKTKLNPLKAVIKGDTRILQYTEISQYIESTKVPKEVLQTIKYAIRGNLDYKILASLNDSMKNKVEDINHIDLKELEVKL